MIYKYQIEFICLVNYQTSQIHKQKTPATFIQIEYFKINAEVFH